MSKGGVEGYQVAEGVDGLGDEAGGVAQEAGDGLHDDQQEVGPNPHHRHPLARVQVPPALLLYGSESGGVLYVNTGAASYIITISAFHKVRAHLLLRCFVVIEEKSLSE